MQEAARRFAAEDHEQLAEWAEQKALEETGHDRLALLDIQSLGYQAEAVVKAFVPPSAKVLVDYFIRSVQTSDPIGAVGYSYTLERVALAVKEKHIQTIEAIIPSGINATRCLRVHSSIGSDVEHVEETIAMVARLTPAKRRKIAIACYETAILYFSSRENDYPSTDELQQKLPSSDVESPRASVEV
jgi:pyrroloquinoline quinone (PQQ) biosynthesis protein C